MAPTDTAQEPSAGARGAALMVSYEELVRIRSYMAAIDAKLDAALALGGKVAELEVRVSKLEKIGAYDVGAKSVRKTLLVFMGGVATTALGGGALFKIILPALGGG